MRGIGQLDHEARRGEYVRMETKHVAGIPVEIGGSGDPSPVTAYGTYLGIKASMKKLTGSDSLNRRFVPRQNGTPLFEVLGWFSTRWSVRQ